MHKHTELHVSGKVRDPSSDAVATAASVSDKQTPKFDIFSPSRSPVPQAAPGNDPSPPGLDTGTYLGYIADGDGQWTSMAELQRGAVDTNGKRSMTVDLTVNVSKKSDGMKKGINGKGSKKTRFLPNSPQKPTSRAITDTYVILCRGSFEATVDQLQDTPHNVNSHVYTAMLYCTPVVRDQLSASNLGESGQSGQQHVLVGRAIMRIYRVTELRVESLTNGIASFSKIALLAETVDEATARINIHDLLGMSIKESTESLWSLLTTEGCRSVGVSKDTEEADDAMYAMDVIQRLCSNLNTVDVLHSMKLCVMRLDWLEERFVRNEGDSEDEEEEIFQASEYNMLYLVCIGLIHHLSCDIFCDSSKLQHLAEKLLANGSIEIFSFVFQVSSCIVTLRSGCFDIYKWQYCAS